MKIEVVVNIVKDGIITRETHGFEVEDVPQQEDGYLSVTDQDANQVAVFSEWLYWRKIPD